MIGQWFLDPTADRGAMILETCSGVPSGHLCVWVQRGGASAANPTLPQTRWPAPEATGAG